MYWKYCKGSRTNQHTKSTLDSYVYKYNRYGDAVRDFRQFGAHAQRAINIRHKSPVNGYTRTRCNTRIIKQCTPTGVKVTQRAKRTKKAQQIYSAKKLDDYNTGTYISMYYCAYSRLVRVIYGWFDWGRQNIWRGRGVL